MLALHLGFRWLRRRRSAWLAVAAIALTVAVPVFVIDLFQGWFHLVATQARANEADVRIEAWRGEHLPAGERMRTAITAVPGVAATAPFVFSAAVVSRTGQNLGLEGNLFGLVDGIDWAADTAIGRLRPQTLHPQPILELRKPPLPPEARGTGFLTPAWRSHLALHGLAVAGLVGAMPAPLPPQTRPRPGVVCGRELLYEKGIRPGEPVQVVIPNGNGGTVGKVAAEISDTIGTGVLEIDRTAVLMPLPQAQRLADLHEKGTRPARVTGWRVQATAGTQPHEVAQRLAEATGARVKTWQDLRGNAVKAIEIQRNLAIVAMIAIQLITVFVIYAVFSTLVAEKRHDIGVLLGLGARRRDLFGAFLGAGVAAGVIGGCLGWGLSWGALAALNPLSDWLGFSLFPEDVFYTPQAPTTFTWWIPALFLGAMTAIALVAVAWPAWRASRVDPIETLRENG